MSKEKIAIIGSGNWGSTISRVLGNNVRRHKDLFDETVNMWVFEEKIGDDTLSNIINKTHINVKYLPGIELPSNVVAVTDVQQAVLGATILVFVIPHQFIHGVAEKLVGHMAPGARAISLIKGVDFTAEGELSLISKKIERELNIKCSVLMGANVADEIAREQFSETTIGLCDENDAQIFKMAFMTDYFLVDTVVDVEGVELCGALKNIVAIAAGIVDGLELGGNTKAAVMRIGLMEMKGFSQRFFPHIPDSIYLESCGVADLITTCYGGRNRKVAEMFAKTGKSFDVLEKEMLDGQKLQGTGTSADIHHILSRQGLTESFPLFTLVYRIAYENFPVKEFLHQLGKYYSKGY